MKKTVLLRLSFLAEVDKAEWDKDFNDLEKLEFELIEKCEELGKEFNLEWESSRPLELDEKEINCGRCEECGRWVSDVEKPDTISELNIGTFFEGRLLCDDHLPKDHEYAF